MLNNRNGQAKILTPAEISLLVRVGLVTARDQALFMLCFYTACRISEARRIPIKNVFYQDSVLNEIVIPKEISKGKQGTRTIPTHPSLAKFLEHYYRESLQLLELKQIHGNWSHRSIREYGHLVDHQVWQCPGCQSTQLIKYGMYITEQYYLCKKCHCRFRESQAIKNEASGESMKTYNTLGVVDSNNYGLLFANPDNPFLFPGRGGKGCLSLRGAMNVFELAFKKTGILGASSHSCRRTALTMMHADGVPLRVLQEISGHKDLDSLQRYLEVSPDQISAAINLLE